MKSDYLIVHKKLLPPYLEKVIEAQNLLKNHDVETISDAVKKVGISRNTYYKYKDYVFEESNNSRKHAVISMVLKDTPGTLSSVISALTQRQCNIVTISQAVPVAGLATVMITIDISNLDISVEELIRKLQELSATKTVELDAVE